jgi:hypothetical protein
MGVMRFDAAPALAPETHEPEERSRGENDENRERGQPPPPDLAASLFPPLLAQLGVLRIRRNCHEGPRWYP